MQVLFPLPNPPLYDDQPTFHAKYEGVLHLMLLKCNLLFIFRLITIPLLEIAPMNLMALDTDCCTGQIHEIFNNQ